MRGGGGVCVAPVLKPFLKPTLQKRGLVYSMGIMECVLE